jgi:hypothetical protein
MTKGLYIAICNTSERRVEGRQATCYVRGGVVKRLESGTYQGD